MLNLIWVGMMVVAVISALITGRVDAMVASIHASAKMAVDVIWMLVGTMAFWLGLMEIAEQAGLVHVFARLLRRPMVWLFPDVPPDHPAMGHMIMNVAANMMGLGNAATPFGIRAMVALQELNAEPQRATDAMCLFLAINTSSVQLLPTGAMALLAAAGASHAHDIVVTTLLATTVSTVVAITAAKWFSRHGGFQ